MNGQGELEKSWKKRFFIIWAGQAFSLIGSMLVQFALVWYLTQKTGSAAVLATATFVAMLPGILIGPLAGALVDRWNRKVVMIVADSSIALATVGLVLLFWSGHIQIWHILVILFFRSLGGTFHYPAMQASTSLMVPDKHLARVAGLNQMLGGVMNIIAPPLGALLLGILPMYNVLAIDILTAAIAVIPLFLVHIPQPEKKLEGTVSPAVVLRDVRDGLRYLASWPGMMVLLGMAALINLLVNPAFSLMPLMITRVFHGEALQLGFIESAQGIGVIGGGLLLSVWGGFKRKVYTSMLGLCGMGIGIALIGSAPQNLFLLALVGMGVAGFMNPITNGPLFALLQAKIAPEMQGRVFTVVGSLSGAMSPLGLLLAAPVADLLGIRFWFWIASVSCVLMAAGGLAIRAVRDLEFNSASPAAKPEAVLVGAASQD